MNYNEAIEYIHSSPKLAKKLGNENLKRVLKELGSPEEKLKYVHIAGTNGKGSTAAMTESVLRHAGIRTGLFISPYIETFNERIKVNGCDIHDEELASITHEVKLILEKSDIILSEFALIFVIGIIYFNRQKCEIVVLETGLGGRLDATNSIPQSLVSAITSIGFDHMQYLGNTISEIAKEKSGIIKNNGTVVLYPDAVDDVAKVVAKSAIDCSAQLILCKTPETKNGMLLYDNCQYELSLKGEYQYNNAAVCIEILKALNSKGFNIKNEHIKEGLASTFWPGRFEWLTDRVLLDGCHNVEGAVKFVESAKKIKEPITLVVGIMKDKDYNAIAAEFSKLTNRVILTNPGVERAVDLCELKSVFRKYSLTAQIIDDPKEAVETALKNGGVCAVCGSLYLIGRVRRLFGPHF